MTTTEQSLAADIATVTHISVVPVILEAVCRITGMGFAAVARVTPERWIACEVMDKIKFGLRSGGELKVDTTICHEIRQSGNLVVIDDVSKDEVYCTHHTPAMYGLQSYISVPVAHADGSFFGTLCAIDPSPAILNTPAIIGIFKAYAALVSFHLTARINLPAKDAQALEEFTGKELQTQLASTDTELAKINMDKRGKDFSDMLIQASDKVRTLLDSLHVSIRTKETAE